MKAQRPGKLPKNCIYCFQRKGLPRSTFRVIFTDKHEIMKFCTRKDSTNVVNIKLNLLQQTWINRSVVCFCLLIRFFSARICRVVSGPIDRYLIVLPQNGSLKPSTLLVHLF